MEAGTRTAHWAGVYAGRDEDRLTWFEARPAPSLTLIKRHAPPPASVIDIGAGASRLVDALLERGYADITLLDLSEAALAASRERLGADAARVTWQVADITLWTPERRFDLWHDRAVFHFLTEEAERAAYIRALDAALAPGGHAVIATFAPDGPETCSGLPVRRYAPTTLADEIGRHTSGSFALIDSLDHMHRTPIGRTQSFQYSVLERRD